MRIDKPSLTIDEMIDNLKTVRQGVSYSIDNHLLSRVIYELEKMKKQC